MTKNIGKIDRIIRAAIGLLMASFITVSPLVGVVGVVIALTGLVGWCGLYKLFGINTCPHELTMRAPVEIQKTETKSETESESK